MKVLAYHYTEMMTVTRSNAAATSRSLSYTCKAVGKPNSTVIFSRSLAVTLVI